MRNGCAEGEKIWGGWMGWEPSYCKCRSSGSHPKKRRTAKNHDLATLKVGSGLEKGFIIGGETEAECKGKVVRTKLQGTREEETKQKV